MNYNVTFIEDSIISKHPIKITESLIAQEDNYLQPFIEIKNNAEHFTYNFQKNTEITRLYFFNLSYGETIQSIYKLEK